MTPDRIASPDRAQLLQEHEYRFPYHYVPEYRDGKFRHFVHWGWSFRYLGGIRFVLDRLAETPFRKLVDVGCGDGRLLREIRAAYPDAQLLGVDYSAQAIGLAGALTPGVEFSARDIVADPLPAEADLVTLIEVLEHIPPAGGEAFIAAIAAALKPGGTLVLTVPHANKPVEEKHFRHFRREDLEPLLTPWFEDLRFVPFDRLASRSLGLRLIERILGGRGRYFLVTNRRLLGMLYRRYLAHHLYCDGDDECGRIAVIARRRAA